jgi:hypothetical protein
MEFKLLYSIYVGIKVSIYKLIKGRWKKKVSQKNWIIIIKFLSILWLFFSFIFNWFDSDLEYNISYYIIL